jgi:hypothetical protein
VIKRFSPLGVFDGTTRGFHWASSDLVIIEGELTPPWWGPSTR